MLLFSCASCALVRPSDGAGLDHVSCEGGPQSALEDRHVRVLFNGRPVDMKCAKPGRDTCTLEDFKRMVDAYCVRDFASECKTSVRSAEGLW